MSFKITFGFASGTLIDHLREVAQGGDDIRLECAGVIAGSWLAGAPRRGEDLIAADCDAGRARWVRTAWECRRDDYSLRRDQLMAFHSRRAATSGAC
jgi:hypothetical protein